VPAARFIVFNELTIEFDRCMTTLTLVRAPRNADGDWSSDDYDVFDGKDYVGRIALTPQAPEGRPWFWRIAVRPDSSQNHGYAVSREQAMLELNARWLNPARV
jgi:hypothetical protein